MYLLAGTLKSIDFWDPGPGRKNNEPAAFARGAGPLLHPDMRSGIIEVDLFSLVRAFLSSPSLLKAED